MTNGEGLYIHVPFCRRKCRYCDFYSRPPRAAELERFVAAAISELQLRAQGVRLHVQANTLRSDTVYVGGGTPSMLSPEQLRRMLDAVCEPFGVTDGAEITVEANPLDVTPEWTEGCLAGGFNRISIGVQSTDEDDLRFLGRLHHAEDGPHAVQVAREAGFREIGIDLIYGLPGQTTDMLEERIVSALKACRPEHVSCYQLTYAEGTPLWRDARSGRIVRLSEDEEHDLFVCVHETLAGLGYPAYEVSNFSLNGQYRSRHNSNYWRHVPYIGLGPSAHSFLPPVRSWNVRDIEDYIARVEAGAAATEGDEELSDEQLASEMVMLALRTTDGLDLGLYRERFGRDFAEGNRNAVQSAVQHGLIVLTDSHIRPTLDGLAVADGLAAELA